MAMLDYMLNELTESILLRFNEKYRLKEEWLTFSEKMVVNTHSKMILDTLNEGDSGDRLLWDLFINSNNVKKTENLSERNFKNMELEELYNIVKMPIFPIETSLNQYVTLALNFRNSIPEDEKPNYSLKVICDFLIGKYNKENKAA